MLHALTVPKIYLSPHVILSQLKALNLHIGHSEVEVGTPASYSWMAS